MCRWSYRGGVGRVMSTGEAADFVARNATCAVARLLP